MFDAEVYLGGGIGQPIAGAPAVKIADEGTWVHPPLGKWIIALLGVGPIGLRSIGWRLPSAIFGIAGVALLYLLALRLWGSVWWAGFSCAPPRARRAPYRPEPDGHARHLPHDVHHRGDLSPGARSRADGRPRTTRTLAPDRPTVRITVPAVGRVLPRGGGGDEMVGRLRALVRAGSLRRVGAPVTQGHRALGGGDRGDARRLVRGRAGLRVPAELRLVLLPARVRGGRLPQAANRHAALPASAHRSAAGELPPVDLAAPAASRPLLRPLRGSAGPA